MIVFFTGLHPEYMYLSSSSAQVIVFFARAPLFNLSLPANLLLHAESSRLTTVMDCFARRVSGLVVVVVVVVVVVLTVILQRESRVCYTNLLLLLHAESSMFTTAMHCFARGVSGLVVVLAVTLHRENRVCSTLTGRIIQPSSLACVSPSLPSRTLRLPLSSSVTLMPGTTNGIGRTRTLLLEDALSNCWMIMVLHNLYATAQHVQSSPPQVRALLSWTLFSVTNHSSSTSTCF